MEQTKPKMLYRTLGPTGLKVSVISYGFMDILDQEKLTELVKLAHSYGVNFFDNAEFYGNGKVEELFGNALKELKIPRDELVISTKVYWGGTGPNRVGLSRKHVIEGTLASLKRLQLDYVDIIMAHRPDENVPLEETCRAFDWLIRHNYAFYWGTSEWAGKRIEQAIGICEKLGLHKPIADQTQYNMLYRDRIELDYKELFKEYSLGTTIWSPLCGGILTGKYNQGIPEDSRYATAWFKSAYDRWLGKENIENTRKILLGVEAIAKELGTTMAQLALAWTIRNLNVSTAIVGSTKPNQLEDNFKALNILDKITPEVEEKLEKVLNNIPKGDPKPRTWQPALGERKLI